MRQHVAFLHTSPVHVETFDRLLKAADPLVQVEHIVAEDLLADAQRLGSDDPTLVKRVQAAMAGAASNGAAIVVCTCSTIGGPAERAATGAGFTSARIDRAMANRAVELGPRILSQTGELFLSLPDTHARACIAFIETVRAAQSWSTNRTPFIARLRPLAKGLWLSLRILFAHRRLLELGRVVVLNSSSQTWTQGADGNFLFRFAR